MHKDEFSLFIVLYIFSVLVFLYISLKVVTLIILLIMHLLLYGKQFNWKYTSIKQLNQKLELYKFSLKYSVYFEWHEVDKVCCIFFYNNFIDLIWLINIFSYCRYILFFYICILEFLCKLTKFWNNCILWCRTSMSSSK